MIDSVKVLYPGSRGFVFLSFPFACRVTTVLTVVGFFSPDETSATKRFSRGELIQQNRDSREKTSKWKRQG